MTKQPFLRVLLFPVGLLTLGCIPVVSWLVWSGHGGFGWILLPICFPYIIVRLTILVWRTEPSARKTAASKAAATIAAYILFAYPATLYTEHYISSTIGNFIQKGTLFRLAIFPIGLAIPNHNPKP
ncbi:MAG TPA: hypothetical protein VFQ18_08675 [Candidatus Acidoferrum sp.]|nr:hypothetical protein [Candidatus Acidoferrum sp.]